MEHLRPLSIRLIQFRQLLQIGFILRIAVDQCLIRFHRDEVGLQRKAGSCKKSVCQGGGNIDRKGILRQTERLQRLFGNQGSAFQNRGNTENVCQNLLEDIHVRILGLFGLAEHDPGIQEPRILLRDFLQQLDSVIQAVLGEYILRLLERSANRRRDFRQRFFHNRHVKISVFF